MTESPEQVIRRAAELMREQCGPGHARREFWHALADLLETAAGCGCEEDGDHWAEKAAAIAVALAYLGADDGAEGEAG